MGRRKIEIKRIEDDKSRSITFAKRRMGIMKKAMELSILCECEIGVNVRGEDGKIYQFCSSDDKDDFKQLNKDSISCRKPMEYKSNKDILDHLAEQEEKEKRRKSRKKKRKPRKTSTKRKPKKTSTKKKKTTSSKTSRAPVRTRISPNYSSSREDSSPMTRYSPQSYAPMQPGAHPYAHPYAHNARRSPHGGQPYMYPTQQISPSFSQAQQRMSPSFTQQVQQHQQMTSNRGSPSFTQMTQHAMIIRPPRPQPQQQANVLVEINPIRNGTDRPTSPGNLGGTVSTAGGNLTLPPLSTLTSSAHPNLNHTTNQMTPGNVEEDTPLIKRFKKLHEKELNVKSTVSQFQHPKAGYDNLHITLRRNPPQISKTGFTPSFTQDMGFSPSPSGGLVGHQMSAFSPVGGVFTPNSGLTPNGQHPLSPSLTGGLVSPPLTGMGLTPGGGGSLAALAAANAAQGLNTPGMATTPGLSGSGQVGFGMDSPKGRSP